MFCPNCGAKIPDGCAFCPECGSRIIVGSTNTEQGPAQNSSNGSYSFSYTDPSDGGTGFNGNYDSTENSYQSGYRGSSDNDNTGSFNYGSYNSGSYGSYGAGPIPGAMPAHEGMRKSIGISILLSIVTCGIYLLIWMANVNDNINSISGHDNDTSGGMVVLLTIITCNIYGIFWAYKMGTRVNEIETSLGYGAGGSNHILYLILSLFGLDIVNVALMQDRINKCI